MSRISRNQQRKARALAKAQSIPYQQALDAVRAGAETGESTPRSPSALELDTGSEAYQQFKADVQRIRAEALPSGDPFTALLGAGRGLGQVDEALAYLTARGLEPATIEHFGLSVSAVDARRLSIPLSDGAGHPICQVSRALYRQHPCSACGQDVSAKAVYGELYLARRARERGWQVPADELALACPHCGARGPANGLSFLFGQLPVYRYKADFDKDSFLYHEHGARHALPDPDTDALYLAEGFSDAWALWQAGQRAVCAFMGARLTDAQAAKVTALAAGADKPLVLVPDHDHVGAAQLQWNLRILSAQQPKPRLQIVHGLEALSPPCKDIAKVLELHGAGAVAGLLSERLPAERVGRLGIVED